MSSCSIDTHTKPQAALSIQQRHGNACNVHYDHIMGVFQFTDEKKVYFNQLRAHWRCCGVAIYLKPQPGLPPTMPSTLQRSPFCSSESNYMVTFWADTYCIHGVHGWWMVKWLPTTAEAQSATPDGSTMAYPCIQRSTTGWETAVEIACGCLYPPHTNSVYSYHEKI